MSSSSNFRNTSKSKLKYLFLILLMTFSSVLLSEDLDSLYQVAKEYDGKPRIEARLQIGYQHRRTDYSLAKKTLRQALNEAEKLGYVDLQAKALHYLGLTSHYADETDTAMVLLNKAVKLYRIENDYKNLGKVLGVLGAVEHRMTGDQALAMSRYNEALVYSRKVSDHVNMAIVYAQLSNIFRLEGIYGQAIEFILKAREQYEIAQLEEGAAWVTYCVGRIYTTMDAYDKAQEYFSDALERYKALPDDASALTGVAISHDELGMTYLHLGDAASARYNNQNAIDIYEELNLGFGLSNACKYRALIEHSIGENELALGYLNRSKEIKKSINDVLGFPGLYKLYGQIYYSMGEYESALDSLNIGLEHAVNNGQKSITISICSLLAEIYAEEGNYEKAFKYRSDQIALSDSISQSKALSSMNQIEALYDNEKREQKIKELEQENLVSEMSLEREITVRNLLLIILSMVVIFAFFMLKLFSSNKSTNLILKGNQKKLQELNATKDKFTSIIAHDLKSPFNSLIGFSGLLRKASEQKDYDKVKEYSNHIETVSTQTYKLLENLLEWARSQTGKISFEPKALDIRFPIQDTIKLMETIAREKQIKIDFDISPVVVLADENMLNTILQNLISNAIKYSYHGSEIKIIAKEKDDMLQLCVRDFGVGMSPEKCDKLFLLDKSVSEPGTDGEHGTGLGLILCKEFAELHRGKIIVDSKVGEGSCFILHLPL